MTAPIALTVHDGNRLPSKWRQQVIAAWLTANDIDPGRVSARHSVSVLTVPFRPNKDVTDDGPWMIQVIVFHQYHVTTEGMVDLNRITGKPVTFQRTVPLKVPFPADSTIAEEGPRHGEADRQAAQETPEVRLRPSRETQVPDTGQGACEERVVPGRTERIEGDSKEDPRQGHPQVPQPQEDRRQATQEEGVTE